MKTKTINLYSFDELSEEAKNTAIENYRNSGIIDNDYIYDEAHATVNKFHEIFGTKEGGGSYFDINTDHINDSINEMKGLRLRTYLINNFWKYIYTGKYYSLWSKIDMPFNAHHGKPFPKLKSRHSKVIFVKDCPLTGVCYDHSILFPIWDFIEKYSEKKYSYVTFEMLMNDCIESIEKDVIDEVDARDTDEAIIEEIKANDYTFTESGKLENL